MLNVFSTSYECSSRIAWRDGFHRAHESCTKDKA